MEDQLQSEFILLHIKSPAKRRLMAETLTMRTSLKYAPPTAVLPVFGAKSAE